MNHQIVSVSLCFVLASSLTLALTTDGVQAGTTTDHSTRATLDTQPDLNSTEAEKEAMEEEHTIELVPVHFETVKTPMVFTIVVIVAGLSKLGFHSANFLSSKVPESCVLIVIGLVFGVILYFSGVHDTITLYEPHEFFLILLPPIVLEAAFSLHDPTFFANLGGVLLFAVLGTVLNCFAIGFTLYGLHMAGWMEEINCSLVQILVFSSLIVAVDPVAVLAVFQEVGVNKTLYFLVFGESLLNDGVTVVMYDVMQTFNKMSDIGVEEIFLGVAKFFIVCLGGTTIGLIMALVSAYITKFTNSVAVVEPVIVYGFAYLSYLLADLFDFSGILSMTMCGIIQIHYTFENITKKSRITTKFIAKILANVSEIIIFMFLGLVTVRPNHIWKTGFALWTVLLCVIFRFIFTFSMSIAINHYSPRRIRKIRRDEMFMISYGGLRGAVSFSLVALINEDEIPMKKMFVTTTLFIIFFTVFVQGGTIKWLVKKMRISLDQEQESVGLNEELSNHVFDNIMWGVEEILGYTTGTYHIKEKIYYIDDNFIRPYLLKNAVPRGVTNISTYYEKLVMKEHYKNLQLGGAKGLPNVKSEIRKLDSEFVLTELVHEMDEQTAREREEQLHEKLKKVHLQSSASFDKFFSHSLYKTFGHLDTRGRSHDHDHKLKLLKFLTKKHKKNKALSKLKKRSDLGETASTTNENDLNEINIEVPGKSQSKVQFNLDDTEYEVHDNDDFVNDNGTVTSRL